MSLTIYHPLGGSNTLWGTIYPEDVEIVESFAREMTERAERRRNGKER